jgi:hypothetical protein
MLSVQRKEGSKRIPTFDYHQLCPGGAPGQTYGCIRSAVGWGCIPPLLAWGGENLLHLSSPVKETVQ